MKTHLLIICRLVIIAAFLYFCILFLQHVFAHRNAPYYPDYEKKDLSTLLNKRDFSSDEYRLLFYQTGLSKDLIDLLLLDTVNGKERVLSYQEAYFAPRSLKCCPVCGILMCTDVLTDPKGNSLTPPKILSVSPGDILVSFSSHTLGWRHGHAALVLDEEHVLECRVLGTTSCIAPISNWERYSSFAVLRVKGLSEEEKNNIVLFARSNLCHLPYRLFSSLLYNSSDSCGKPGFGLNCSTLVWYAYDSCGIHLCSNFPKITTPYDLFQSDKIEVIQIYGLPPRADENPSNPLLCSLRQ